MAKDGGNKQIPARRREGVRKLLNERGSASISEISAAIGVSESTIRRDLEKMSGEGIINRSHGGAISRESMSFEPMFEERRSHKRAEKKRIGTYAATLLKPDDSVIFDSSSTVLNVIEALELQPKPITAITNDVRLAVALTEVQGVDVIMPGGEIRTGSFTLLGSYTQGFLSSLHVEVALMGVHSVHEMMLNDTSLSVAEAKRAMAKAAQRVILLADNSKFETAALFDVIQLEAVHDLVTNTPVPQKVLNSIKTSGKVQVHVV